MRPGRFGGQGSGGAGYGVDEIVEFSESGSTPYDILLSVESEPLEQEGRSPMRFRS